jgi:hypothetical protein
MTTMALEHEDTGEHAFLPEDMDALFYGVHSAKSSDADGELTVQDILDRRPAADILVGPRPRRLRPDPERGPGVKEIQHRLELERLATEQEKTDLLDKALARANWWEEDSGGILLKPRYPAGPPKGNDPDDTVGFLAFNPPQPGQPGFRYDEPPLGHETGSHPLTAVMARVDPLQPPPYPLWKQLLISLGLRRY